MPLGDARIGVFIDTMRLMKENLAVPKGAYVTGPFTLAGLMMGATEIVFILHGERLRGRFILLHTGENQWLFFQI